MRWRWWRKPNPPEVKYICFKCGFELTLPGWTAVERDGLLWKIAREHQGVFHDDWSE